jgi:hypothetical protein
VKSGADALMEFVSDLGGRLDAVTFSGDGRGYLVLTVGQSLYLGKVRDGLLGLRQAFPERVVLGSNPSVEVPVDGMRGAAEASARLRSDIQTARRAFSLGESFKLEVSGGEMQIQR